MVILQVEADSVPAVLKATRGAAHLSTRQMGEALGVSHTTVAAWELGKGEPSITQFILWAEATKQAPEQLLQGLIGMVRPKRLELPTF